jgi:hypothetical protein
MVSQRQRRRGARVSVKRAALVVVLLLAGCSRRAEIEDTPQGGQVPVNEVPRPADGVPLVEDAPLENAQGLTCAQRPTQVACRGANDFGCVFDEWFQTLTEQCQQLTDCHTDGWVEVFVGSDGCASELRMEDPDVAYVTCISELLSEYRCPCQDVVGSRFLGLAHDGCTSSDCGTGELRCPPGMACEQGRCVSDGSAGAGG